MATPNVNAQEVFGPVNGGDILHFRNVTGAIVSWIDSTGTGQGNLASSGSGSGNILPQVTKTGNYTTAPTDAVILVNSASATAITLTAAGLVNGQLYRIKNISTGTVTITPTSGTIDNAASIALTIQYQSVDLQFDGTNFWIF